MYRAESFSNQNKFSTPEKKQAPAENFEGYDQRVKQNNIYCSLEVDKKQDMTPQATND